MKHLFFISRSHYTGLVSEGKTHFVSLIDCATQKPVEYDKEAMGIKSYGDQSTAFKNARKIARQLGYKVVPKRYRYDY